MPEEHPFITRCKTLIGGPTSQVWEEENLLGFFGAFRPDGAGVEAVFEGLLRGEAVLSRLKEVYAATSHGFDGRDWYFIVRQPPAASREDIEAQVKAHLHNMACISEIQGETELAGILGSVTLEWVPKLSDAVDYNSPNTWLYDVCGDFMADLEGDDWNEQFGLYDLLDDAFYSIANDYNLKHYILWPLYADVPLDDPFAPYFWLWRHDVHLDVASESVCQVCVGTSAR